MCADSRPVANTSAIQQAGGGLAGLRCSRWSACCEELHRCDHCMHLAEMSCGLGHLCGDAGRSCRDLKLEHCSLCRCKGKKALGGFIWIGAV